MFRRDHQDHVVFHEGLDVQILALLWAFDECKMDLASQQSLKHLIGISAPGYYFHPGVCLSKACDEGGQKVLTDGLGGSEGKLACLLPECLSDRGDSFIGEVFYLLRKREECFAAGSQSDTPTSPIEERYPELVFKGFDLLGYCRLCQQQFFGGAAEVQMVCHRSEDPYAEVLYHDPIPLSPCSTRPTMLTTAILWEMHLSLCRFRACNSVQGVMRYGSGDIRGQQIAQYDDWQKMPLPGELDSHQSSHQGSMCYGCHQQSHSADGQYQWFCAMQQVAYREADGSAREERWSKNTPHSAGSNTEGCGGKATGKQSQDAEECCPVLENPGERGITVSPDLWFTHTEQANRQAAPQQPERQAARCF